MRTCGPSQWANSSPALLLPAPVLKARPYIEASHTCASYFRTYSVAAKLLCNPDITQFLSQDVEYTTRWYVRFTKSQNKHPLCISSICCTAHPQSCCCCCCCSHINSHQVRGRRAGSSHSGAEEYLQETKTQAKTKVVHAFIAADDIHTSVRKVYRVKSGVSLRCTRSVLVHTLHYSRPKQPTTPLAGHRAPQITKSLTKNRKTVHPLSQHPFPACTNSIIICPEKGFPGGMKALGEEGVQKNKVVHPSAVACAFPACPVSHVP